MNSLDGYNRSVCRSCGAPMVWVRTKNNKLTPLDPTPVADGNVVLTAAADEKGNPVVRHLTRAEMDSHVGDRYVSHFATCPDAPDHRRR